MARTGIKAADKAGWLKVFQAQSGFYDSVVAAGSQAATLRVWGTHQNLLADAQASVTTDAAVVEPNGLPAVPDLPNSKAKRSRGRSKPAPRLIATSDAWKDHGESDRSLAAAARYSAGRRPMPRPV